MKQNIEKILFSEKEIARRVSQLASDIIKEYMGKKLTIVALSNGAIIFVADLIRKLTIPIHLDTISAHSYDGLESTGKLNIISQLKTSVKNRHVLIVDDILDTGKTLEGIVNEIKEKFPLSVKICVLLDKPARRTVSINADFTGFKIDDFFVIGYGMDFNEKYRNLPYIGILKNKNPA